MIGFGIFIALMISGFMARWIWKESRKARWSTLELIVAVNVAGHGFAWPVVYCWRMGERKGEPQFAMLGIMAGIVVVSTMLGGAAWTLRNLEMAEIRRPWKRVLMLVAGMLFVPSVAAIPYNLVLGWFVWIPLMYLSSAAQAMRLKRYQEQVEQIVTEWRGHRHSRSFGAPDEQEMNPAPFEKELE